MHQSHLAKFFDKVRDACVKRKRSIKPKLSANFSCLSSPYSNTELSTQLKQVFQLIDSNGDGKISPLELGEVLLCLGHEKSTATSEAEGMVKVADCDGDGFIDFDEFLQTMRENKDEEEWASSEEDLTEAFAVFDADKNGFISAKELRSVLVALGHGECGIEECRRMIKGVDKNGDGLIDFDEFRSMMRSSGRLL